MARAVLAAAAFLPLVVLLLPAALVAALLVGVTAAARAVGRLLEPEYVPWSELMTFDHSLGWRPRPNLNARYLADLDDTFRVITDGHGWPGRRTLAESRMLVLGDSFVFGYGIDTARSFTELDRRLQAKAIGAPGYSMVQGVRLLEEHAPQLRGKLVVWCVFLENDLQDNLRPEMRRYRAPFVRPVAGGQWEIVDWHLSQRPWRASDLDRERLFAQVCRPGAIADRAFSAAEWLIARAETICRRAGARLAVLTIPHPMQLTPDGFDTSGADPSLPDTRLAAACRAHGVPMIAGRSLLTRADYKRREGIHWNRRGHRRMAGVLAQLQQAHASGSLDGLIPGGAPAADGSTGRSPLSAPAVAPAAGRATVAG